MGRSPRFPHLAYSDLVFNGVEYEGGTCTVREAEWTDPETGILHRVAVKSLQPAYQNDEDLRFRFTQEATLLCETLRHDNIIVGHTFCNQDGVDHLVMELADFSLKDLLEVRIGSCREECARCAHGCEACPPDSSGEGCHLRTSGAFSPDEVLALIEPVLRALAYAHGDGILHRDIKPHNVLLVADSAPLPCGAEDWPEGIHTLTLRNGHIGRIVWVQPGQKRVLRVVLSDFGIARDDVAGCTRTGSQVMGTPDYMSPEQVTGQRATRHTDVYSLGVMIFELLTGRVPHAHVCIPPPPPSSVVAKLAPGLLPGLDSVVLCALCKKPEERFDEVSHLLDALKTACAGRIPALPVEKARPPEEEPEPPVSASGERRWLKLAIFAPVVALFVGAGLWWWSNKPEVPDPQEKTVPTPFVSTPDPPIEREIKKDTVDTPPPPEVPEPEAPPPLPAPQILEFSGPAGPVYEGQPVVVSWRTIHGDRTEFSGPNSTRRVPPEGSTTETIQSDVTLHLVVWKGNESQEQTLDIFPIPVPPDRFELIRGDDQAVVSQGERVVIRRRAPRIGQGEFAVVVERVVKGVQEHYDVSWYLDNQLFERIPLNLNDLSGKAEISGPISLDVLRRIHVQVTRSGVVVFSRQFTVVGVAQ